jgi:hypothetical protein
MNMLICGDSFSVGSSKHSWANLLKQNFNVVNLSQAGCSEYRILKQLESVDLKKFDKIVVNHTSPYRIYIKEHPIHKNDTLHHSCDLIYSDVASYADNDIMRIAKEYFENIFDMDYAKDIYKIMLSAIDNLTANNDTMHCSHLEWDYLYLFKKFLNLNDIWTSNKGEFNHYSIEGNKIIYQTIKINL